MSSTKVTVKDLAQICGVSIGTVDRAINDRPGINPKTKENILNTARELGFVKNQNALDLRFGQSKMIGILITDLGTEFLTSLVTSVEEQASKRGYSTVVMMSRYAPEREWECIQRMRSMHLAGLIVLSVLPDAACLRSFAETGVPVIAVGNRVEGLPFVGIDDKAAMEEGTRHVLSRGYERLVYVAPLLERATAQNIGAQTERYHGFLDASAGHGERVILDNYETYERFMAAPPVDTKKTALICPTDVYTVRCLPLRELGFGIMGFDRLQILSTLIPGLAGVRYPTVEIGARAVDRLVDGGEGDVILPFTIADGTLV